MFTVRVIPGDITNSDTVFDAIITCINSEGLWFGGVDRAIIRVAGKQYHDQLPAKMPIKENDSFVISPLKPHRGKFKSVIFLVDDIKRPTDNLVLQGLEIAQKRGFVEVGLPLFRTGVMLGAFDGSSLMQTVAQIATATRQFMDTFYLESNMRITFVVYNEPAAQELISNALANT